MDVLHLMHGNIMYKVFQIALTGGEKSPHWEREWEPLLGDVLLVGGNLRRSNSDQC